MTAKELIDELNKLPSDVEIEHFDDVYGNQPVEGIWYPVNDIETWENGKPVWIPNDKKAVIH